MILKNELIGLPREYSAIHTKTRRHVKTQTQTGIRIHMQTHTLTPDVFFFVFLQDSTTVTPVTLTVDPKGYFLYWTDQNKVRHCTPTQLFRFYGALMLPLKSTPETLFAVPAFLRVQSEDEIQISFKLIKQQDTTQQFIPLWAQIQVFKLTVIIFLHLSFKIFDWYYTIEGVLPGLYIHIFHVTFLLFSLRFPRFLCAWSLWCASLIEINKEAWVLRSANVGLNANIKSTEGSWAQTKFK